MATADRMERDRKGKRTVKTAKLTVRKQSEPQRLKRSDAKTRSAAKARDRRVRDVGTWTETKSRKYNSGVGMSRTNSGPMRQIRTPKTGTRNVDIRNKSAADRRTAKSTSMNRGNRGIRGK